jgi:uncharacterized protein (TIGR02246 family)
MASDPEAVEAANRAFYQALEARDLHRMEEIWAVEDDISCIHPGWHRLDGRDEVSRAWRAIFANSRPWRASCESVRIFVAEGLALVVCVEKLETIGGEGEPARMQATNVFRKAGGEWKMLHHHSTPMPDVAGEDEEEPVN